MVFLLNRVPSGGSRSSGAAYRGVFVGVAVACEVGVGEAFLPFDSVPGAARDRVAEGVAVKVGRGVMVGSRVEVATAVSPAMIAVGVGGPSVKVGEGVAEMALALIKAGVATGPSTRARWVSVGDESLAGRSFAARRGTMANPSMSRKRTPSPITTARGGKPSILARMD